MRASQSVGPYIHIRAAQQIIFSNVWQFVSCVSPRVTASTVVRSLPHRNYLYYFGIFVIVTLYFRNIYIYIYNFSLYEYIIVYKAKKNINILCDGYYKTLPCLATILNTTMPLRSRRRFECGKMLKISDNHALRANCC